MKSPLALMALLATFTLAGCAATQQVSIPQWRPAELDTRSMRRVAVVEFTGNEAYRSVAREEIAGKLAARHDTPPTHVLRQMLPASIPYYGQPLDTAALVAQARAAGFDGLLVGEVNCSGGNGDNIQIGNPILTSSIRAQLIDVRSGRVLGEATAGRKWQGRLSNQDNASNSKGKVFESLVRSAATEIVGKLNGTTEAIQVPLAEPADDDDRDALNAGLDAARQGNWDSAASHFERARVARPTSYAALYNLGVAHEARWNYPAARHFYQAALAQRVDETARNATARVETALHAQGQGALLANRR